MTKDENNAIINLEMIVAGRDTVTGDMIVSGDMMQLAKDALNALNRSIVTRDKEVDDLNAMLKAHQGYTYASMQKTACAVCGVEKHTPLRVDRMGGYVCLSCISVELYRK